MAPSSRSANLLPSLDLVHRSVATELAYTLSRMQVLERIPGNPIGIAYRRIENGPVALMARHLPSPFFNSVVGLRAGHEAHIEPLVAWYRENDATPRFLIVPGDDDAALGRELTRFGYYQSGFQPSLIGESGAEPDVADGIAIELVTSAGVMEDFLDAYVKGWGFASKDHEQFKANVRAWLGQAGWSLYLGRIDGRAAAAAVLFVHENAAYLADAATDPSFRQRGLHRALLRRRIADAAAAGVDF